MERPELAVLVAYSKRLLARALEASDFVEEPWLERDLREYFPAAVVSASAICSPSTRCAAS